jgi:DNA-binding GntR family transcriptional regulator
MARLRPEDIASLLRRAIRQRVLPPGQALNQDDLAKRFGVSRIPLREALRTLAGEGLIVIRPGIGAVVTELSAQEVEELYDLRLLLEPTLVAAAARQCRRQDVEELASLVRRMDELAGKDAEAWSNLNYTFHRRLNELSGRRHTVRLIVQVLNLIEPYSRVHAHVLGSLAEAQEQHHRLLAAVADGDPEKLRRLVEAGIQATKERLIAAMQEAPAGVDPFELLLAERA